MAVCVTWDGGNKIVTRRKRSCFEDGTLDHLHLLVLCCANEFKSNVELGMNIFIACWVRMSNNTSYSKRICDRAVVK